MNIPDYAEYVSPGHPDRLADAIAERLVTQATQFCPRALVGVEVAVHDGTVFVDGRIAATGTTGQVDNLSCGPLPGSVISDVVRQAYASAGYGSVWGPAPDDLVIHQAVCLERLSAEENGIRSFSDDQNVVTGYACWNPATGHLPVAHYAAHRIGKALLGFRESNPTRFGPDFKVLALLGDARHGEYVWNKLVVSLQHAAGIGYEEQHRALWPVIRSVCDGLEQEGLRGLGELDRKALHLNGAGDFVIGGPRGDNGLTGKKLVVDHYGPTVPIGGGALTGRYAHKVDRCGPLRARQWAKQLVGPSVPQVRVALGWAPGLAEPCLIAAETADAFGLWRPLPGRDLPAPAWFAIDRIVGDLELLHIDWPTVLREGFFTGRDHSWER